MTFETNFAEVFAAIVDRYGVHTVKGDVTSPKSLDLVTDLETLDNIRRELQDLQSAEGRDFANAEKACKGSLTAKKAADEALEAIDDKIAAAKKEINGKTGLEATAKAKAKAAEQIRQLLKDAEAEEADAAKALEEKQAELAQLEADRSPAKAEADSTAATHEANLGRKRTATAQKEAADKAVEEHIVRINEAPEPIEIVVEEVEEDKTFLGLDWSNPLKRN